MTASRSPLDPYRRKRDFDVSPEPPGSARTRADRSDGLRYVVQKHAARRLHYDLRLELDGVLMSWAVPKGPSLDPSVRRLAVHVEDHPLEYGSFEGVIPAGEYGGGTVLLWDRGRWEPEGDAAAGLSRGRMEFRLSGERLKGGWRLVRMGGAAGEDGRNWLLQKRRDAESRTGPEANVVETASMSVASGRTLEEIAREGEADVEAGIPDPSGTMLPPAPAGAPKSDLPRRFRPQLPVLERRPPEGDDWLHELKFDGYRILAWVEAGKVRLVTRGGEDWTTRFAPVAHAVGRLGLGGTILDGEVAVLTADGTTDFQALQNVAAGNGEGAVYFVFDLPFYEGHDLRGLPLEERKALLAEVVSQAPAGETVRYSDHIRGQGEHVADRACRLALEGIVAKRARAPYREGRSPAWVKVKCLDRQEFVVGGWTEPSGSRQGFGALLLGWYDEEGRLRYAGRVGTGFGTASLARIRQLLDEAAADRPPFADLPAGQRRKGVHWVEPRLVAEVEFGSWTGGGILRHASFRGLREDKEPKDVTRERPVCTVREGTAMKASRKSTGGGKKRSVAGVRMTNPDRVLYPEQGSTKRDLAEYYEAVADHVLPHVVDRPLTLVRCPQGRGKQCFYQKHLTEGMPAPVRGIRVEEKKEGSALYVGVDDVAGLVTLVQFGVLEMHPWGARADRLDRPDRLIFDLDPGDGVGWKEVVDAALRVRRRLDGLGLVSFVRTTGGKGIHVVSPLVRRSSWDDVKAFAGDVARGFAREDPGRFVATMSKARRQGRIFIDYLRNSKGATAVASYSSRARPGAPVATPLDWDELGGLEAPDRFTIRSVPDRLRKAHRDPWEGFFDVRQSITRAMREAAAG